MKSAEFFIDGRVMAIQFPKVEISADDLSKRLTTGEYEALRIAEILQQRDCVVVMTGKETDSDLEVIVDDVGAFCLQAGIKDKDH